MNCSRSITRSLAILTMVLAAAACSGGDDDDSEAADTPAGRAIAEELLSEDDSPIETEEEARCMAGGIVSEIGEDRLEELGVTAGDAGSFDEIDFTDDEYNTIIDSLFDCIDVTAGLAEEFESDFGEEGGRCVAENLDDDLVRDLMLAGLRGDDEEPSDEFLQAFLDIAAECDLPLGG